MSRTYSRNISGKSPRQITRLRRQYAARQQQRTAGRKAFRFTPALYDAEYLKALAVLERLSR